MQLLWITIVLALLKCNCAQEETTVSQDLIDSLFNPQYNANDNGNDKPVTAPENNPNGIDTPVPNVPALPLPPRADNPCRVGECVPFYRCMNGSIITNGDGILDLRFGDEDEKNAPPPEEHPCPDFFETCCSVKSPTIITQTQTKATPPITPMIPDKCGVRNKNGAVFQINERDNEAQFAEFPWAVAIIYKVHDNDVTVSVYKCGGSLIHPGVVITAAHCVIDLKEKHDIMIRAGEWDTQTVNEPFPHQDRAVIDVVTHEHYTRGSHWNDVALLFLDKPVDLAGNVNTICLPPPDFNFDHQRCFANGWGKDKFGQSGLNQVILKRIELPVVPHTECQLKLRETRLGKHFELHPSFMCAGGESGRDVCTGDGGSPFSCEIPQNAHGQYYLAGEVAWGIGCFEAIPGVYVNVAGFRNWIDKIFVERNLEQKYYIAL